MYKYSERLAWATPENPFSLALSELRASGRPLLDLTVSNPTEAIPHYPHAEIAAALSSIPHVRYQPEPLGLFETRAAIVRHMQKCGRGALVSPGQLALTASTSEAYSLLFKLLANPGDEILVPAPSYPLFEFLAQLESVKPVPYRLAYDGSWFIDFSSLEQFVSKRTRALVLVNPNNPTGSFLKMAELQRLQQFALAHSLPLISDEVFIDYAFGQTAEPAASLSDQDQVLSFTLNGLSKSAAMPQMKLGWIVVTGPLPDRRQACSHLELLLDTYLSVSTPVQLAAETLLAIGDKTRSAILDRVRQNRSVIDLLLANTRIHPLPTEGGWSVILRVPQLLNEEEWIMRLLLEHGVVAHPGYFFDMPPGVFLVVSLLTDPFTLREGIANIRDLLV